MGAQPDGRDVAAADGQAIVAFLLAVAALTDAVAAWHLQARRDQQVWAARAAAHQLREAAAGVRAWNLEGVAERARRHTAGQAAAGEPQAAEVKPRGGLARSRPPVAPRRCAQ